VVDALGVVDEHSKPFLACQLESQHLHTWYRGLDEARYVTLKLSFLLELSRCHFRTNPHQQKWAPRAHLEPTEMLGAGYQESPICRVYARAM
jgi:hypothetical protein